MRQESLRLNRSGLGALCLLGGGLLAFGGCDDMDSDAMTPQNAPLLMPSNAIKWPNGVVNTCWTLASTQRTDFATLSQIVQDRVNDSWGRVANVRFVGWALCPSSPKGIVTIDLRNDMSGDAGGVGYPGSGGVRNMILGAMRPDFAGSLVPHEFGHILGFDHEMRRGDFIDDADGGCMAGNVAGGTLGTPPDRRSIMASTGYCQNEANLSPWDIVGVQNAYGRKNTGSLVGLHNRCVDLPGTVPPAGQDLQVRDCDASWHQLWVWASSDQLSNNGATSGFMQVEGGTGANGSSLEIGSYDTNNPPRQLFSFSGVSVRGIGETCVDVPGFNFVNGQRLEIFTCNGGSNQSWTAQANGNIRNGNFCWDVAGGSTANGTPIQIAACSGGTNQQFTYAPTGELRFGGKCVDVVGGTPNDGSRLQLFTCKSSTDVTRMNQLWHLTGPVRSMGRCLDIRGGLSFNGAATQIFDCAPNSSTQTWDYYFKR